MSTYPDKCHPSRETRVSTDASSYDEICTKCGATDRSGAGWGNLRYPCDAARPKHSAAEIRAAKAEALKELAMLNATGEFATPSNICAGDGHFANSLLRKYECETIEQLEKWAAS